MQLIVWPVQNKRRHPRFTVEGLHGTVMLTTPVEILNMSMGGAAVVADMRLNPGREYALRLELDDGRSVAVKSVVVWATLSGLRHNERGENVSRYSAGLKFTDVISDALQQLLDFIDSAKVTLEKRLAGVRFRVEASGRARIDSTHGYEVRLISLSGMLIRTGQPLALEGVHPMELIPPGEPPIRFAGRVASSLEVDESRPASYDVGIEFVEVAPQDRGRLEAFVAALAEREPRA